MVATVTLQIPDGIYHRLEIQAQARNQSLESILLHALNVGSPPDWHDVPLEFQADLMALEAMSDEALEQLVHSQISIAECDRYDTLLDLKADRPLSLEETAELADLRKESDRFMLRKAQAAALLQWRGTDVRRQ